MIDQVLIAKRIFSIGESYAREADSVSAGLAISLFQDAVEHVAWSIAKHNDISVKETESFTSLLNKIDQVSHEPVPQKAKMLELNKARVGFKHYGNLPAPSEPEKFRTYTYDFLVLGCQRYLGIEFDEVSLASLIKDTNVRSHIDKAKEALANDDVKEAVSEAALARFFLFKKLEQYLPKVDHSLRDADRLFDHIPALRGARVQVFEYLTEYLSQVARFNAAALAGGSVGDHLYFERALPQVIQFAAGNTQVEFRAPIEPSTELAERAIQYVVDTSIRLENVA